MAYYRNQDYCSEADMKKQGWSEIEKAEQREKNWDIRLEHYAKNNRVLKNCVQFRKMVDEWAESFQFPSSGVPTMKMLHILKIARENGLRSDTLSEFARAEEELLERIPGFVSPAAVKFNVERKNELCLAALKARAEKRERKVAAILSKTAGRTSARDFRDSVKERWAEAERKGHEAVEAKVAALPAKLSGDRAAEVAAKLVFEMYLDIYVERINDGIKWEKHVTPDASYYQVGRMTWDS
jgi:hypothetical protein